MKNFVRISLLFFLATTAGYSQTTRATNNLTHYSDQTAKQTLDSVYNRLGQGDDFAKLTIRLSQDPGSFANGGQLDWQQPDIYVPEFRDTLKTLLVNQYSKPFKTAFGYHIVQLLDSREDKVLSRHILLRIEK